jgi:hypothetical protein
MTITGTVHHVGQTEVISDKFSKRLLVVKTEQEYNNLCPVEFTKDKAALLDGLQIGQSVSIEVNLGGREWNGKYFASINGWKLNTSAKLETRDTTLKPQQVASPVEDIDADMLPF